MLLNIVFHSDCIGTDQERNIYLEKLLGKLNIKSGTAAIAWMRKSPKLFESKLASNI